MAGANAHFKCFLGNLSPSADEAALKKALEHIESFAGVKIMYDKFDGKPRGFGWAYFNDTAGMKAAHALSNRILIHGRAVLIQQPREAGGTGEETGAPAPKRRKPHKPIHGAIEIAHAAYAEMDKSAYQMALINQRRQRVVEEPTSGDLQSGLLLPQPFAPESAVREKQQSMPVKLTVRAKPKGADPAAAGVRAGEAGGEEAAPATSDEPAPATAANRKAPSDAPGNPITGLLAGYGDSGSEDDDSGE